MKIDENHITELSNTELSDLLKLMKETTMKIDYDDMSVDEEESLRRIIDIINNELKGITHHYDRKLRSQNRWIAALFLLLKDAGVEPSSRDIVNALRRIDENAKHSA